MKMFKKLLNLFKPYDKKPAEAKVEVQASEPAPVAQPQVQETLPQTTAPATQMTETLSGTPQEKEVVTSSEPTPSPTEVPPSKPKRKRQSPTSTKTKKKSK